MTTNKRDQEYRDLYNAALAAGVEAGESCKPAAMIVGSPTTPLGSDIDYNKETYYVADGPCGFAWINVADGRSSFAKWLIAQEIPGVRKDSYYGGVSIWVRRFGQSLQRKEACAHAAAKVLRDAGIKAHAGSRMD